jgi:hypothetical protein
MAILCTFGIGLLLGCSAGLPSLTFAIGTATSSSTDGSFYLSGTITNEGTAEADSLLGYLSIYGSTGGVLTDEVITDSTPVPPTLGAGSSVGNVTQGYSESYVPYSWRLKFTYADTSGKSYDAYATGDFDVE